MQPGVVLARLNEHLLPFGRLFGPDPANGHVTTMGSVIAIDASGSHWLQYGSARRHVESLQVVLSDGTVMEVGREPRDTTTGRARGHRQRAICSTGRRPLFSRMPKLIERRQPKTLVNQCGYQLGDVLTTEHLDFGRLLSGSGGNAGDRHRGDVGDATAAAARGCGAVVF